MTCRIYHLLKLGLREGTFESTFDNAINDQSFVIFQQNDDDTPAASHSHSFARTWGRKHPPVPRLLKAVDIMQTFHSNDHLHNRGRGNPRYTPALYPSTTHWSSWKPRQPHEWSERSNMVTACHQQMYTLPSHLSLFLNVFRTTPVA